MKKKTNKLLNKIAEKDKIIKKLINNHKFEDINSSENRPINSKYDKDRLKQELVKIKQQKYM